MTFCPQHLLKEKLQKYQGKMQAGYKQLYIQLGFWGGVNNIAYDQKRNQYIAARLAALRAIIVVACRFFRQIGHLESRQKGSKQRSSRRDESILVEVGLIMV